MIIVHETMPEEASAVAQAVKEAYGIESTLRCIDLEGVFRPILGFNGYWSSSPELSLALLKGNIESGKAVLVLTPRDLYFGNNSRDDDWVFGYSAGDLSVISSARMKREDGQPSDILQISQELYFNRLKVLGVHELGHELISEDYMQPAAWVNTLTGHELELGAHCTDNTCVMYEVVDIKSPPPTEGYMRLGKEKKFDGGLDDVIKRLRPDYLCNNCRSSIKVSQNRK